MEGCLPNVIKYVLFVTNFLVFVLGIVTLGFDIWVVVDKLSFLNIFEDVENVLTDHQIDMSSFNLGIFTSAPTLLIVASVIVTLVAFFGCFGSIKENKCLLITYFVIIFVIFVIFIVGEVLVYQGKLETEIKKPLLKSITYYNDNPAQNDPKGVSFKNVWNTVQLELRCCGVNNVTDWKSATNPNWKGLINKPMGCCKYTVGQEVENTEEQIKACQETTDFSTNAKYYFQGCYTIIVEEIESKKGIVFGAAIGTMVVMFLNMLFAFAMYMMVEKGSSRFLRLKYYVENNNIS